jgi:hypothetical protein
LVPEVVLPVLAVVGVLVVAGMLAVAAALGADVTPVAEAALTDAPVAAAGVVAAED